jgi:hypothetical protein
VSAIFGGELVGAVSGLAHSIVNAIAPDKTQVEKDSAAQKIAQLVADSDAFKSRAAIVQAEVGGSGIKAWWRPVTMLTFVAIVVARFLGYDAKAMTPDDYAQLWVLIKIGLGGYVGGRSVEKVATTLAPVLKR